ncbi:MAG TPA: MBL fold metallo-hydrolase [Candidatus Binatia bacterium]|nr:MBL fold metallo-hydrolase [Candidatus Binatia bacterium]
MTTVRRVVAPNPSPFTGPGTNTWILGDAPVSVVIDPGPDDDGHLQAIDDRLGQSAVGAVLLTHGHGDHVGGADKFAARHHVRVLRHPELADGDKVHVGDLSLTVLHTPGHAPDHLAFWLAEDRVLFTGDLILGQGSSMVTYPEGDVAAYLRSLERVAALEPRMLFPGHWDPVNAAAEKVEEYRTHRLEREAQVVEELRRGGPGTAAGLTERVYAAELGGNADLLRAAEMTLRAHLRKLVDEGRVSVTTRGDGGSSPTGNREEVYALSE